MLILFILFNIATFIFGIIYTVHIVTKYIKTDAYIVSVSKESKSSNIRSKKKKKSSSTIVSVSYEVEAKQYKKNLRFRSIIDTIKEGEKINIYYNSNDPKEILYSPFTMSCIIFFINVGCIPTVIFLAKKFGLSNQS